jgi:Icc protein
MKVLHITDSHLYADTGKKLKNIQVESSFQQILSHARRHHANAELVILGGDMAQDERLETYQRLCSHLSDWSVPFLLSPGNHSNGNNLREALLGTLIRQQHWGQGIVMGNWHVISLDSSCRNEVAGDLSERELNRLKTLLKASRSEHVLLAVHHHPLPVQCAWLDQIMLRNAHDFWSVVDTSDRVRAVLHGHTHQQSETRRQQVRVLGSPSTCIQFKPHQEVFTLDVLQPGYRWLELREDGHIRTGVERIEGFHPDISDREEY